MANRFKSASANRSVSFELPEDEKLRLEELENSLQIDRDSLDDDLERQPQLYFEVSKRLALLISRRDAAKQYIETVESRVDTEIRRRAREDDIKTTEVEIKAQKSVHPEVAEANEEYLRLAYAASLYSALKDAYTQRSYAIKDLVGLFIASYYADNAVSGGKGDMRQRSADIAREGLNEERHRRAAARGSKY